MPACVCPTFRSHRMVPRIESRPRIIVECKGYSLPAAHSPRPWTEFDTCLGGKRRVVREGAVGHAAALMLVETSQQAARLAKSGVTSLPFLGVSSKMGLGMNRKAGQAGHTEGKTAISFLGPRLPLSGSTRCLGASQGARYQGHWLIPALVTHPPRSCVNSVPARGSQKNQSPTSAIGSGEKEAPSSYPPVPPNPSNT